jgi:uncharacterized protein YdhG (YjbR/CyaY superfamily)
MSAIDDYLSTVISPLRRVELERIRAIALEMLPGAEEVIAYGMPTIKYRGKSILGFDAHKNHIGIYPYSGSVILKIKELDKYDTTKGAIRENLDEPLPKVLIQKIIHERLEQAF